MRVIAGRLKGRRLKPPAWDGLRPTSDKLRETLFNVLGARVEGAHVLDGYAGTGAVGIEALSRGAARVVFVERDRRAAALIAANLAACGVERDYTIHCGAIVPVLQGMPEEIRFDLVVLDPPYEDPDIGAALAAASGRLAEGGLLVLERATRHEPDIQAGLLRLRDVRSGDSTLTFIRRESR